MITQNEITNPTTNWFLQNAEKQKQEASADPPADVAPAQHSPLDNPEAVLGLTDAPSAPAPAAPAPEPEAKKPEAKLEDLIPTTLDFKDAIQDDAQALGLEPEAPAGGSNKFVEFLHTTFGNTRPIYTEEDGMKFVYDLGVAYRDVYDRLQQAEEELQKLQDQQSKVSTITSDPKLDFLVSSYSDKLSYEEMQTLIDAMYQRDPFGNKSDEELAIQSLMTDPKISRDRAQEIIEDMTPGQIALEARSYRREYGAKQAQVMAEIQHKQQMYEAQMKTLQEAGYVAPEQPQEDPAVKLRKFQAAVEVVKRNPQVRGVSLTSPELYGQAFAKAYVDGSFQQMFEGADGVPNQHAFTAWMMFSPQVKENVRNLVLNGPALNREAIIKEAMQRLAAQSESLPTTAAAGGTSAPSFSQTDESVEQQYQRQLEQANAMATKYYAKS